MTKKTMQDVAKDAILVQNACNLSGVVHAFSTAVTVLREQRDCTGTTWINEHPVSILFSAKIASLTGVAHIAEGFEKAYEECEKLAAEDISLAAIREIERINKGYDAADEARQQRNLMSTKDIGYMVHEDKLRQ
jgi:hypothetical protein